MHCKVISRTTTGMLANPVEYYIIFSFKLNAILSLVYKRTYISLILIIDWLINPVSGIEFN